MKILTFLIPCFNEENNIYRCLKAVTSQTIKEVNYEIVVIDNNSTDNSLEIIKKFKQVKVLTETQKGIPFARNRGIKEANTEYVAFIDADVEIAANWAEVMLDEIRHKNVVASQSAIYPTSNNEDLLLKYRKFKLYKNSLGTNLNLMCLGLTLPVFNTAASIFKLSALKEIDGFNTNFQRLQDIVCAKELCLNGGIVTGVNTTSAKVFFSGGFTKYLKRSFTIGKCKLKYGKFFIIKDLKGFHGLKLYIKAILKLLSISYKKRNFLFSLIALEKLIEASGFLLEFTSFTKIEPKNYPQSNCKVLCLDTFIVSMHGGYGKVIPIEKLGINPVIIRGEEIP